MSTQLPPEGISQSAWDEAGELFDPATTPANAHHVRALVARAIMAATERAAIAGDSLANDIEASAQEIQGNMRDYRLHRAAGIRHLVSILRNPAALAERVEAATRESQNDNFKSVPVLGDVS